MPDLTIELEEKEMASQNHAVTQLKLGAQLFSLGDSYTATTGLSLDMSTPARLALLEKYGLNETSELKPDLVLYQSKDFGFISPDKGEDKPRVPKVPLLCVEIVSPTQGSTEIRKKIRVTCHH